MLSEETKERIKREHIEFLEKRHAELVRRLDTEEKQRQEELRQLEIEKIKQAEEDALYADNPNFVKYFSRDGKTKWVTREEFNRRRYHKKRVRKKHKPSWTKQVWNKASVILIVVSMILVIYFAFKLVASN